MIKEVLQSVDGNVYYTIAGLVIFVIAFAGVLFWTWTLDNQEVERMRAIPFDSLDPADCAEAIEGKVSEELSADRAAQEGMS